MSVNAYEFLITLWNTIYKNPPLGVSLCNSWAIFCRSSRLWFFSCFHAKRKVIFFLRWSVEYFLILAIVFCLVLRLEYYKLLVWVGFHFLGSFCLPGGETCPAVHSPLEGSLSLGLCCTDTAWSSRGDWGYLWWDQAAVPPPRSSSCWTHTIAVEWG